MPEASRKVTVAVDAMGGDYAPGEIVRGAVLAAQKDDVEIILVGPKSVLGGELAKCNSSNNIPIRCVEADEIIGESEPPALAVRRKPNCSIAVAAKLVKSGEADALVGAGSTGAVAVSGIQFIGMVQGMERPTVGGTLGRFAHNTIVMDIGANVDCKPQQFLAFAIAGSVFAKNLLHIANPTVALLSTGVEEGKGSELVRESYSLLKNSGLNFIGNIEGSDVLSGRANVVICDGFVGNVLVKFYESIGDHVLGWVEHKLKRYPPLSGLVKAFLYRLFPIPKLGYEGEQEGGGILWGIDGVVRIAHGSSRAPHIAHAIAGARDAVEADIVGCLKSELAKLRKEGKL
ncbi:MAG: phosphate acyltransferase PlsX [Dehalococcoidia bacterium]|nr:MAG: phosphate acyltransferase PlsX [Dehalococcoidia bacterium]